MAASPASPDVATVRRYLPWVVASALFMEQLDSTIINTAVPTMAESLQVTPLSLKSVVTSYVVSLAVCIPASGWMADRFGTRRVFSTAVAIFTLSSILCGLALSAPMLVATRVLQGIGAAMMMPVGRLAIVRTFPKADLLVGDEFRHHSGIDRPHAGTHDRRAHRALAVLARDLLRQRAGGYRGTRPHPPLHARLPRRQTAPLRSRGPRAVQRRRRAPVLAARSVRRTLDRRHVGSDSVRDLARPAGGVWLARTRERAPAAPACALQDPHLPRLSRRRVRDPAGHRRSAVPASPPLSTRPWPAGVAIGVVDGADRRRRDGDEIPVHSHPAAIRIPAGAGRQHGHERPRHRRVFAGDAGHADSR